MGNWWDDSGQIAALIRDGEVWCALRQSLAWSKALRRPAGGIFWRALLLLLPPSVISSRSDLFSEASEPAGAREDLLAPAFRTRTDLDWGPGFSSAWMEARPERMKHFRGL